MFKKEMYENMYEHMMSTYGLDIDGYVNSAVNEMNAKGDEYWAKLNARGKREKESNEKADENINRINEIRKNNGLPPLKFGGK